MGREIEVSIFGTAWGRTVTLLDGAPQPSRNWERCIWCAEGVPRDVIGLSLLAAVFVRNCIRSGFIGQWSYIVIWCMGVAQLSLYWGPLLRFD